jgi:hypothetical protein
MFSKRHYEFLGRFLRHRNCEDLTSIDQSAVERSVMAARPISRDAMTRDELETALDRGRLQIKSVNGGKWYDIRRNGADKDMETRPGQGRDPLQGWASGMLPP